MAVLQKIGNRTFLTWNLSLSALAVLFLFWLIYFRGGSGADAAGVAFLPAVNATLNSLAATCLLLGLIAVRRRRIELHRALMVSAFIFSVLFLICYVVYHSIHGNTPFPGTGWIRPVYFFILVSHIVLSVAALPLIFTTFFFALKKDFRSHRRVARITLPVWLYVSVTGVAVFFLLRAYLPAA